MQIKTWKRLYFYLEALNRQVKKPNENPSVGLLLCATKNDEVVEYSMIDFRLSMIRNRGLKVS